MRVGKGDGMLGAGAVRTAVAVALAAAVLVGGAAADLKEGVARAGEVMDNGAAEKTLANLVRLSNLPG